MDLLAKNSVTLLTVLGFALCQNAGRFEYNNQVVTISISCASFGANCQQEIKDWGSVSSSINVTDVCQFGRALLDCLSASGCIATNTQAYIDAEKNYCNSPPIDPTSLSEFKLKVATLVSECKTSSDCSSQSLAYSTDARGFDVVKLCQSGQAVVECILPGCTVDTKSLPDYQLAKTNLCDVPPKILDADNITVVLVVGNDVQLNCAVEDKSSLTEVLWTKNGNSLTVNTNRYSGGSVDEPSLTIKSVQLLDAGVYRCLVSNNAGSVTGVFNTLELKDASSTPRILESTDRSVNLVEGKQLRLNCTLIDTSDKSVFVTWTKDNNTLNTQTGRFNGGTTGETSLTINNIQLSDSGDYKCIITSGGNRYFSGTVTLTVTSLLSSIQIFRDEVSRLIQICPSSSRIGCENRFTSYAETNENTDIQTLCRVSDNLVQCIIFGDCNGDGSLAAYNSAKNNLCEEEDSIDTSTDTADTVTESSGVGYSGRGLNKHGNLLHLLICVLSLYQFYSYIL